MSDDVHSYASEPRNEVLRFASGRGRYVDDIQLHGMLYVAFMRSPFARASFVITDISEAQASPGVHAVFTGRDIARVCKPWSTRFGAVPNHLSPEQHAVAIDKVHWQGEPVAAVVARTRAEAEDAVEKIMVDWEEGIPVVDPVAALEEDSPLTNSELKTNLALDRHTTFGDADEAFANAAHVVSHHFEFGRQTGVTFEMRAIIASYDPRVEELTVYESHQVPFQQQEVFSAQLGIPLDKIRVITPDVGGGFGIKLHSYPDEIAVAAMAKICARPLKYQVDRLEAFVSDAHAREIRGDAELAVDNEGKILGLKVDLLSSYGAFSIYPRSSVGESFQALDLCGAAYRIPAIRGRIRGVFLNKVPSGAYRAVGQPIACAIIEQLLDNAAADIGMDPLQIRRINHLPSIAPDAPLMRTPSGLVMGPLSLDACMDKLVGLMDYDKLRAEQIELKKKNIHRGIGLCTFVEMTGVGPGLYGLNGVRVAGKESVRLSFLPSGKFACRTSATDQGQGITTGLTQVIAKELGVALDQVVVQSGDTTIDPVGGGAWASRGMSLAGEAALQAARSLRENLLMAAAAFAKVDIDTLRIGGHDVVNADGVSVCSLVDLAMRVHYNTLSVPLSAMPPLTVEKSFSPFGKPYFVANGVQAAHVEVDIETGFIKVLDFWVVEDCGRVINPLLVDEQVRGGVVQGIGAALYENCIYSETGQMSNASMADYLVPMASEMPDIHVAHVSTPERETELGAKGVGEAGTVGAVGALWCAVNDAIRSTGKCVTQQPFTPAHVLDSLTV